MKVNRMTGKFIIALLGFIILLAGCTSKYARPYSARKTIRILSEGYGIEIELLRKETSPPPYASSTYTLRDKSGGFTFTASASVKMDRHIPIIQRCISDNHRSCAMLHHRAEALQIAAGYGLWFQPIDSLGQLPDDRLYISDIGQMEAAAHLYFDLKRCYGFNLKRKPRSDYFVPELNVYQLFNDEEGTLKARFLCDFDYEGYYADPDRGSTWFTSPATLADFLRSYWNDQSKGVFDVPERKNLP